MWKKVLLALIFLIGAGIFLYPTLSDLYNKQFQNSVMQGYLEKVEEASVDYSDEWKKANDYNAGLLNTSGEARKALLDKDGEYADIFNISGNGVMGIVSIPKIDVRLPIYHGTEDTVLKVGAGHLIGTSLPTGEPGTHCAISGHTGLPSAKLFTDLDQLEINDTFTLQVLDKTFEYTITDISIVEPDDTTKLGVQDGKDLCTLVTCTPYGVNSHRLLITGERDHV